MHKVFERLACLYNIFQVVAVKRTLQELDMARQNRNILLYDFHFSSSFFFKRIFLFQLSQVFVIVTNLSVFQVSYIFDNKVINIQTPQQNEPKLSEYQKKKKLIGSFIGPVCFFTIQQNAFFRKCKHHNISS